MTEGKNALPRPYMYQRSVRLPQHLRDQLVELAHEHERTLADEMRHALRLYVSLCHRRRQRQILPEHE